MAFMYFEIDNNNNDKIVYSYLVLASLVHSTSSHRNQTCNTVIYIFKIRITIRMLHRITKRLKI